MIARLAELLPGFAGQFSRTRCFLHILNITAQSLLTQFDVKVVEDAESLVDKDVRELMELARGQEQEEREAEAEREGGDDEELFDDDDESWVDEVASLSAAERAEFEREVRPVKMVLVKVSGENERWECNDSHCAGRSGN